jgi:hypothetical protein
MSNKPATSKIKSSDQTTHTKKDPKMPTSLTHPFLFLKGKKTQANHPILLSSGI